MTDQDDPTVEEQAPLLLGHIAGYASHRTISMGLRHGLLEALAGSAKEMTPEELAGDTDLDAFYVAVWCRSALGAGVLVREDGVSTREDGVSTREDGRYRLAPHMDTLLLDPGSPAYVGGIFTVFEQHELFDRFESVLDSGERLWWDQCSPDWIAGVAGTGTPFYTRLVPNGLGTVPGLVEQLAGGGRIVDTACGAGSGLVRLAEHFPGCEIVGVDGDAHSIDLAAKQVSDAGVADRVTLQISPLEELTVEPPATLVVNNISMHECRDIDQVIENVLASLEPGGWFVISDFPFPEDDEGLRSVPGRIMSGIQFFEAQIDDQLLPRSVYDDLLTRHGFTDLGAHQLTPVHALTWGRRPE